MLLFSAIFLQLFSGWNLALASALSSPTSNGVGADRENGINPSERGSGTSTTLLKSNILASRQMSRLSDTTQLSDTEDTLIRYAWAKIKPLGMDQSVFPGLPRYSQKAQEFAARNGKVFYNDAWSDADRQQLTAGVKISGIEWSTVFIKAFIILSKGRFFLVGNPGSYTTPSADSATFWDIILPLLKNNQGITGLVLVNPNDPSKQTTIWPLPMKPSINLRQKAADVLNEYSVATSTFDESEPENADEFDPAII